MHLIGSIVKKKEGDEQFIIMGKRRIHNSPSDKFFVYNLINFEGERCGSIESKKLFDDYIIIDDCSLEKVRANVTISYDYLHGYSSIRFVNEDSVFSDIYITKIEFNDKCASFLHDMKPYRAFNKEIQLNLPIEVANAIFAYLGEEYRDEEDLEEWYKREMQEWNVKEFPEDFKKRLEEIGKSRMNNIYFNLLLEKNMYPKDVIRIYESKLHCNNYKLGEVTSEVVNSFISKYSIGETKLKDGREGYLLFSRDDVRQMLIEFTTLGQLIIKDKETHNK